ncbi:MAG: GNAT family N-acetyltransferase, partial [Planctomycetales bacterium]|nr:GNAT family N-acetyltransferase [Planctomycetales bacterium]
MFRIRRIYDNILPINRVALQEVTRIFVEQFPSAPKDDVERLPESLQNPFRKRFRTIVYVAENTKHQVLGFAIVLHEPELHFCYLDYIAAGRQLTGRGIGAALYERLRDDVVSLRAEGLFFECLPD